MFLFVYLCHILLFIWLVDDDLEGYDKMVSGRRKTGRVSDLDLL